MKNSILIVLSAIAALSASAADSEVPDNPITETESSQLNDAEMHKCLKAFDEALHSRIIDALTDPTQIHAKAFSGIEQITTSIEAPKPISSDLLALNTNPERQPL